MFDNIYFFLNFRKQNKMISKKLEIKRDKKLEYYLLFGLWQSSKMVEILKRNCRCYLEYYEERDRDPSFKDLNYVINRIMAQYNIIHDNEILKGEIDNFDNVFSREYIRNKVKELLDISGDTRNTNLVGEAVI